MSHKKESAITIGFLTLSAIALVIIGPLAIIWSLNTLFPVLSIPYTLETWFATVFLSSVFKTKVGK
jgi:hypothetical protein